MLTRKKHKWFHKSTTSLKDGNSSSILTSNQKRCTKSTTVVTKSPLTIQEGSENMKEGITEKPFASGHAVLGKRLTAITRLWSSLPLYTKLGAFSPLSETMRSALNPFVASFKDSNVYSLNAGTASGSARFPLLSADHHNAPVRHSCWPTVKDHPKIAASTHHSAEEVYQLVGIETHKNHLHGFLLTREPWNQTSTALWPGRSLTLTFVQKA